MVIATRERFSLLDGVLGAFAEQVRAIGGEVVVVGGGGEPTGSARADVRFVPMSTRNLLVLRARALAEARGRVIAIGEDHTLPTPGWAAAVLRAHAEHPGASVVVGCLENRTVRRMGARASFAAYASDVVAPMTTVPRRPPPASAVSFKREALGTDIGEPGRLETEVLPRLHVEHAMAVDDRIVLGHYQDFGVVRAVRNGFWIARASHGYACDVLGWSKRDARGIARRAVGRVPTQMWREAKAGRDRTQLRRRDLPVVLLVAVATGLGASVGAFTGPGRAPDRIA